MVVKVTLVVKMTLVKKAVQVKMVMMARWMRSPRHPPSREETSPTKSGVTSLALPGPGTVPNGMVIGLWGAPPYCGVAIPSW